MKKFLILTIILFSISLSINAQETIDLNQAINIALENNTAISNLKKSLNIQKLSTRTAKGNLYPNLSFNAGWTRNNTYSDGTVRFQNGVPIIIPQQDTWINNFSTGLSTSVTLFNGFSNLKNITLQEQNEQSVNISIDKQVYDVAYNVTQAYFKVLKNEKIVIANEDNVKDAQSQLEKIKEFMNVGKRTMADVYRQDVQVAQNELALERSKNDYKKSKVDLLYAMNTDVNKEYNVSAGNIAENLSEENLKTILNQNSNSEVLVNQALEKRYDYKAALQDVTISQTQLSIDKKNLYFPTLTAFANYNLSASRIEDIEGTRSFNFGLSLNYSIFQGFQLSDKKQASEIAIKQKQDDTRQIAQQIRSEIKKSYIDMETAYKQVEILNRNILSAEQDKLLSEENYRVGLGTLLDVQTATTKLNSLVIDRINAYYDFFLAQKTMEFYSGNLNY